MKYTLEHVVSPMVPGGVAYFLKEVDDGYDLIQVRRGLKANLPATLEPGEPAFCRDSLHRSLTVYRSGWTSQRTPTLAVLG